MKMISEEVIGTRKTSSVKIDLGDGRELELYVIDDEDGTTYEPADSKDLDIFKSLTDAQSDELDNLIR